ncbi:hypothetical protein IGI04_027985 [Brassica rapa subsp. trilocularis]|uniref:Uncharacterized protein n=3 Tax=Brassica TaxID=3705 RepID=M4CHW7_BRACM|nr:uncharacterized protein LOC103830699 [Brassica rapa]XP_013726372.1 uncharacterized protein BNAA07G22230D [Brassica napus]KAG5380143.1 hypothetical protein IGI04_027985 [Brassica rapa subsp. trilocularis]KAH0919303.1 hypothetical protein HID58_026963 [Brassica napus]CAF2181925.1 unnamed protein product [Brassica napus]
MARRQLLKLRTFLVLAVLSLVIVLKPVLVTPKTEKQIGYGTKGQELNETTHLRRIEIDPKRRTRTRRLMDVEEINDYPGSGANNRHTPRSYCPDC